MEPSTRKAGFRIIRYECVASTSSLAMIEGEKGAPHGTVVAARSQSGGRGRLGRPFSSPPGGLYFSTILRPDLQVDKLPLITLAAGVAAAESIQLLCGMEIMLKWPNDLYLDGRKLGGILTETSPLQVDAMPTFVVVGMGINVNSSCDDFPSELRNRVTSLYCLTHRKHDLDAMLELIMKGLLENVTLLRRESEELLQRWRARDMLLGKRIRWDDPRGRELTGTGQGLLDDGRYRLTTDEGREYSVLAGDITLREIDGRTVK